MGSGAGTRGKTHYPQASGSGVSAQDCAKARFTVSAVTFMATLLHEAAPRTESWEDAEPGNSQFSSFSLTRCVLVFYVQMLCTAHLPADFSQTNF